MANIDLLKHTVLYIDNVRVVTLTNIHVVLGAIPGAVAGEDGVVNIERQVGGIASDQTLVGIVDINVTHGRRCGVDDVPIPEVPRAEFHIIYRERGGPRREISVLKY